MKEDETLKTMEEVPTFHVIQNKLPIGKTTFLVIPNSVGTTFLFESPPKRTSCTITELFDDLDDELISGT